MISQYLAFAIGYFYGVFIADWTIAPLINRMWQILRSKSSSTSDADEIEKEFVTYPWQASLVGITERILYISSLLFDRPEFIAVWLTLKTIAQSRRWTKAKTVPGRAIYNTFLIGNGLSIGFSFVAFAAIQWALGTEWEASLFLALAVPIGFWAFVYIQYRGLERISTNDTSAPNRDHLGGRDMIRTIIYIAAAAGSLIGIVLGTLGLAVLFSVDLPGLALVPDSARRTFVFVTFGVLILSWVLFFLERRARVGELEIRLSRRRKLQDAIDELSTLRSEGVNEHFAGTPEAADFDQWISGFEDWETRVVEFMKRRFTGAITGLFSELGAVPDVNFSHASDDPTIAAGHKKTLKILTKELAVLERIIQQGSNLVQEPNPSVWEILRQQQQAG